MKLAFFIFRYALWGGLQRDFLSISKAALAAGHELHIFTTAWQGECLNGASIEILPPRAMTNHGAALQFAAECQSMQTSKRFDLRVGFNKMPGLDIYFAGDVCVAAEHRRRHLSNGGRLLRLTPRYRVFERLEASVFSPDASTRIWHLTESARQEYIDWYDTPRSRFSYLPPGIDKSAIQAVSRDARDACRARLGVSPNEKLLIMVGSDYRRKGVDRAIKALAALPADLRSQCKLLVVGQGQPKKMVLLARKLRVSGAVIFHGPSDEVPLLLKSSDYLLHPARIECAGNVILEGIVAGLGVLVTGNCGFASHVADAGCGLVCEGDSFQQTELNRCLGDLLLMDRKILAAKAINYAGAADLYSRPQKAVSLMADQHSLLMQLKQEGD